MQIIKCEMCGSNDLIKHDGVFVCQHCGCKYTLDEARKLITDGPIEVTGTITIKKDNLAHIKKLGDEAYERGDWQEAYKYYTEVVEDDPADYERKFKRMIASASGITINTRSAINGPINHLDEYIESVENDTDLSYSIKEGKIVSACSLVTSRVVSLHNLAVDVYIDDNEKVIESSYKEFLDISSEILKLQTSLLSYEIAVFANYKKMKDDILLTMDNIISELLACTKKYNDSIDRGLTHYISNEGAQYCYDVAEFILNERRKIEPDYILPSRLVSPTKGGTGAQKAGCYIATCVYGSYDCPEVWTLRRYRDYCLGSSWYGRLFIKCYYAISPQIVKIVGDFKKKVTKKSERILVILKKKE